MDSYVFIIHLAANNSTDKFGYEGQESIDIWCAVIYTKERLIITIIKKGGSNMTNKITYISADNLFECMNREKNLSSWCFRLPVFTVFFGH